MGILSRLLFMYACCSVAVRLARRLSSLLAVSVSSRPQCRPNATIFRYDIYDVTTFHHIKT